MKHYSGRREGYAVIVTVDGRRLNPRLDLWNLTVQPDSSGVIAAAARRNWHWRFWPTIVRMRNAR